MATRDVNGRNVVMVAVSSGNKEAFHEASKILEGRNFTEGQVSYPFVGRAVEPTTTAVVYFPPMAQRIFAVFLDSYSTAVPASEP